MQQINSIWSDIQYNIDQEKSAASWAMRRVMELDNVQVIRSGMSDSIQIADNIHTGSAAAIGGRLQKD